MLYPVVIKLWGLSQLSFLNEKRIQHYLKDGEQIAQVENVDECGSTEHIDMMKKFQEDCVGESGDVPVDHGSKEDHVKETKDESDELLKVDFMSQGDLVDPVVDAFSCGEEFEKQESVLQSDVDLELHREALRDEESFREFECKEHDNNSFSMVENVSLVETASKDTEKPLLLNQLCTSVVYPCRFPKRCKVSAVRDFPDALKILKALNEASEKNLNHRTTCDSQNNVERLETKTKSQESSAPTEKGLSRNLKALLTPPKEDPVNFDEQELAYCGANSTALSTQSTSEVTNSNKQIGGKERVKCINKTIVEDLMATSRCPMSSQCYQSDTKTNQDKGKGKGKDEILKRNQNEGSALITVVLALMAPTKCPC
ncbi:hypothetical protein K7X08_029283 [Anisodus acutangulus]|uniref:Uncharacterized protein n=1 Tax=Anisodus acutangulus TaxID=402998 RepID=A0A9Q1QUL3_9SOLA|nr:hypothetical protein K7X08_029283 [Anisodus acutangulus]